MDQEEFKRFLLDVLDEAFYHAPADIHPRWSGGVLELKPGNDSQAKEVPIEILFRKILSVRDALRVLEQKLNTHDKLTAEEKASFQGYITKAYGSLTTFNILFKEGKDKFYGSGGKGSSGKSAGKEKLSLAEAKQQIGLNEY